MAVTTVLFWVSLIVSVIGTNAKGEFTVLHSPDSLKFTGSNTVRESTLKEIFSAALGLSVEENSAWDGLVIGDPFTSPEAVVNIFMDGVPSLGDSAHLKGPKYPVEDDEFEPDTFNAMKHRIQQRYPSASNNLVSIKLSNLEEFTPDHKVFGDLVVPKLQKQTYQYLKPSVDEDLRFLMELAALKAITNKVSSGAIIANDVIDFFNLRFSALHALSDYHGPNSMQVKEAKKLLCEELEILTKAFEKAYDGKVLVTVVTTDVAHTRRPIRSVSDSEARATLRTSYPEDYAAIFNILLWFGVVFVFTLIAIVYALIDMDPGRDSIIYRMTSTRMKKDN